VSSLLDMIFGTVTFTVSVDDAVKTVNLIGESCIYHQKMKRMSDGRLVFQIRLRDCSKVKCLLDKSCIKDYSIICRGMPFLLKRYRKRYGLVFGAFLFCALLFTSKLFVWEVSVSGNNNCTSESVESQLADVGFGVGSFIPSVDFYSLCNSFMQNTDDFSFVSVNMEGTTAVVEVRERKTVPKEEEIKASNLVAKFDGQIESMTVYNGKTVVEKGAVVRQGELLVSGFLEKKYGFDIVRSSGNVYAYVSRILNVDVPFCTEQKVYTGIEKKNVELQFFGKSFSVYSPKAQEIGEYDVFVDRERLVLFDAVSLPLIQKTTSHREYVYETVYVDEDDAKKQAEKQMESLIQNELSGAEILENKTESEKDEDSYKLTCRIYCLMDIAHEKIIEVD